MPKKMYALSHRLGRQHQTGMAGADDAMIGKPGQAGFGEGDGAIGRTGKACEHTAKTTRNIARYHPNLRLALPRRAA